jgi:hypothetical protein
MSIPAFDTLLARCRRPDGLAVIEAESLTAEEAGKLAAALSAKDIQARVLDGTRLHGKADLLRTLAKEFNFPAHFGHNWDALIDAWSDLSWLPADGWVCILLAADAFRAAHPQAHDTFLDTCEDVAERWREWDPKMIFKMIRAATS